MARAEDVSRPGRHILMPENSLDEILKKEIERGHFAKALIVAEQIGLPEEEKRNLRKKALGQMSAVYRNIYGAKHLAQEFGLSREEVKQILIEYAEDMRKEGNLKILEPCYDYSTGKYLSFEQWMEHSLKIWDRL
jgi:hypothetical protein